ncbi:MAG: M15 family metallopeptidase [Candidatus Pedobacter colombiensis]|uniref:D-alanyl-D-alanine dipeptidase n=1 Tax=Candidatus Pedobacter colombiensis TaxID=3121371 RepID=A0AAJ5W8W9_9SPHI|nr:M15 family metallopeptidase [Pedobacter sp.]WEK19316.1 MAG: M15 family metallopeptidase [Pedobacter sp.]
MRWSIKKTILLLLVGCCLSVQAQKNKLNPFGLKVDSYTDYLDSCKKNTDYQLLEITKYVPGLVLDIKYATKDNFMKRVMYPQARAFARRPVVMQLKRVQAELKKKGYGLKIFDAYRPYSITVAFYKEASDKAFVANPNKGSRHNRGCAIDLTLIDLKSGQELKMPTPYDSFAPEAAVTYTNLPPQIIKNRQLLISTMQRYGFKVLENEWWHFDFTGWQAYDLMDISFQKL